MKTCSKCGAERKGRSGWCAKCLRQHRYEQNRELIESRRVKCSVCGDKRKPVLDFHHTHDKEYKISRMVHMSKSRLVAELGKCICVCANCHRMLHVEEVV